MPKSSIRFEYKGALAHVVGNEHGIRPAEWKNLGKETAAIAGRLNGARHPFRNVPQDRNLSQLPTVLASAEAKRGKFADVVVLGIGGSALGLTALKTALCPPYWNLLSDRRRDGRPRLWVMDNVDPDEFFAMTEAINPHSTLFNIISKSGETAETVSQFLVILELLQRCIGRRWKDHMVITTDARKGLLRPVVDEMGLESFIVPDGLGGRFSVMSPVGTFPAAMLGIEVRGILAGAHDMEERCASTDFRLNPAAQGAAVQIGLYRRGKHLSVMMPYAAALRDVADWYRQLWAESLGKISPDGEFVGPTPIKALGVTDQHSQVQLYREGPNDKVFTILSVGNSTCKVRLPAAPASLEGFGYLRGRTMQQLMKAEELATIWALAQVSRRPTTQIIMPKVTPRAVGGLLHMLMMQTSIAGEMLGINTYNQPGVEAGKHATKALMGMKGPIADPAAHGLPREFTSFEALRGAIDDFRLRLADD